MTKYQEYFKRMLENNEELFDNFAKIHADYSMDENKWQEKFNEEGTKVLATIREWENKLCRQSEKAGYGNYTGNLAEKFQGEVKKHFPLIDHIGIVMNNGEVSPEKFFLKRINLSS